MQQQSKLRRDAGGILEVSQNFEASFQRAAKVVDFERARSKLFVRISHELYTWLALLQTFDDGHDGWFPMEARHEVGRLRTNAARLVDLVSRSAALPLGDNTQRRAAPTASSATTVASGRAFLARVNSVIDGQMANEDFNVGHLARHLAMSRSSLYQRLKDIGHPPAGLILERRLQRAVELLSHGAGSVAEVADATGFKSVSHFSQRFRRRFGRTPSAYRLGVVSV